VEFRATRCQLEDRNGGQPQRLPLGEVRPVEKIESLGDQLQNRSFSPSLNRREQAHIRRLRNLGRGPVVAGRRRLAGRFVEWRSPFERPAPASRVKGVATVYIAKRWWEQFKTRGQVLFFPRAIDHRRRPNELMPLVKSPERPRFRGTNFVLVLRARSPLVESPSMWSNAFAIRYNYSSSVKLLAESAFLDLHDFHPS